MATRRVPVIKKESKSVTSCFTPSQPVRLLLCVFLLLFFVLFLCVFMCALLSVDINAHSPLHVLDRRSELIGHATAKIRHSLRM